ncbi:hypothetical protein CYMTET_47168 [Cymbomonas tetramitiformis]|uniref:GRAM domain-containing protein n=1 Tax=Cymbomonas tetramitiformis TaxID=36881 RepID=A0AAE0BW51_9CHLO|nr:hypothetical protein CYMTET_47168 [Cymbomonas tetramitiformis]
MSATGYPVYTVQAAPAQYQGYAYSQQPPPYVTPQTGPTMTEQLAVKSAVLAGKALDAGIKTASKMVSHAAAAGWEKTLDTASGKVNYVAKMLAAGGTSSYWKRQFDPPSSEKLVETYACHLQGDSGLVAGVMFIGSLSISFCSDVVVPGQNMFLKFRLPLERVSVFQPAQKAGDTYIGVIMLDQYQFWFAGFMSPDKALEQLQISARNYQASLQK